MEKTSVTCFGVGDGEPCADRNHSAFLYDVAGQTLLIDCGEPLCRSYKASGRDFSDVDRILISHYHFDHVGGFFMFIQGSWLEGRTRPLPVHLPAHGIAAVRQLLQAACLFEEVLPFTLQFIPWELGRSIESGGVRITPFPTTHLEHFRKQFEARYPGYFEAFGFLLEGNGQRLCHSADLGSPDDLDSVLQSPLDLLVCEVAHFKPDDLFAKLRQAEIGKTVLMHVGRGYWEDLESLQQRAAEMMPGRTILFARDQQVIRMGDD